MSNYEYANGAGLSVLSQKIFENLYTNLNLKADKATTYTKTNVDGLFDEKGLVDIEEGTDSEPYFFKVSPYGDRLHEKIVGGSIAWNQLVNNGNFDTAWGVQSGATCTVSGNVATVSFSDDVNSQIYNMNSLVSGHTFLSVIDVKLPNTTVIVRFSGGANGQWAYSSQTTGWQTISKIWSGNVYGYTLLRSNSAIENVLVRRCMIFDLTQLFGSSIADYIYSLEQSTAGAGVAFFRKLFPKNYYPYDAGSIQSVSGLMSHDTVGFNLWDEEWELGRYNTTTGAKESDSTRIRCKNKIPIIPDATYYIKCGTTGAYVYVYAYDKSDNLIDYWARANQTQVFPSNTAYITISPTQDYGAVYNHDICINISDASKNGIYEPYVKHSYPLDSSLTLRGIPKLVNNKLTYDGDVYNPDGKVTRRYGIVDLGTLNWSTNGNDNVYAQVSDKKASSENLVCNKLIRVDSSIIVSQMPDNSIRAISGGQNISVQMTGITTQNAQTKLAEYYLVYELATPIEESAHPFQSPQRVTEGGTEEYVTTGIVPVGHESTYVINKAERFDAMPDVAPLDGDYIVRQKSGAMALVDVEDYAGFVESETGNPVTIETDAAQYAKNTHLTLAPVQDLHGYDHPWPAGGGKNLLPMTVDGIKAANTSGTWSGNAYTYNGIVYTILTDSDGNVIGINVNGSANSTSFFGIAITLPSGNYIFNGCPQNGASNTYRVDIRNSIGGTLIVEGYDTGSGNALQLTENTTCYYNIRIESSYNAQNLLFKPMIRLSTGSADFAPYSNICPITPMGHRNLLPMTVAGIKAANTTGVWSGNTYAIYGLTFELEVDGDGNVIGIKVNGTASVAMSFWFQSPTAKFSVENGSILTGCPSGGSDSTYGWGVSGYSWEYGNGETMHRDATSRAAIWVNTNVTINNLVFKPMLRPASDPDSTFVPYGMARVVAKSNGKNRLKNELVTKTVNGVTFTNNSDGSISLSGTASVNTLNVFVGCVYADKAMILNGYKGNWSTPGIVFHCYERGTLSPEYVTQYDGGVELPAGKIYDVSISVRQSVNTDGHIIYPMARYADVENDTYEPYQGHTASVDLPEPVYSGTLDLETGEVVADMGIVDLGDLTWTYQSNYHIFAAYVANIQRAKYSSVANIASSIYKTLSHSALDTAGFGIAKASGENSDGILVKDANYTDAALFKTAVTGQQFVYELLSPITYQLTPQQLALFKGTNNISTNAKTVQVTYRNGELATTDNIVDAVEVAKRNAIGESANYTDARLATELAPILGNFATAETSPVSASHAVGEYLLYNKHLYKVLAAISAGQQLTIGTNIGQTNVAAELASQASAITVINSRISDTAGFHNGIYRGKDITSYLTDGSLWDRIKGTNGYALFDDIYLGDFITVGSNSYAIVDFDYYLRCGSVDLNEHHIVMMPTERMNIPEGTALYGISGQTLQFINTANAGVTVTSQESATGFKWNAKMSDPNTHSTNGGYKYSRMRQVIMKAANTIVINAFGSSHVKPITVLYPNPASESASGIASGWAWFANDDQSAADAKSLCDLPNETQIYGQQVWGRGTVYTNMGYEVGTDKFQFAICALQRNFVDTRAYWWLRSVDSASYAALVNYAGYAGTDGTAYAYGVRPRFLLVG